LFFQTLEFNTKPAGEVTIERATTYTVVRPLTTPESEIMLLHFHGESRVANLRSRGNQVGATNKEPSAWHKSQIDSSIMESP
jgi:hypothetical protein